MTDATKAVTPFSLILNENKREMTRIDDFRKAPVTATTRNLVFAGGAVGGLVLVGAIATQIVTGVVALVVAGAGVATLVYGARAVRNYDPVVQQKMKNHRVELMTKEARKRALSQLRNQVVLNAERLEMARASRDKVGAQIEKLKEATKKGRKLSPHYRERMENMLGKLTSAYEVMCANISAAAVAKATFEQKVNEYAEMEKFSAMASDIMTNITGNKMEDMLTFEAFDSIETDFHTAMVSIENSTRDAKLDMEYENG